MIITIIKHLYKKTQQIEKTSKQTNKQSERREKKVKKNQTLSVLKKNCFTEFVDRIIYRRAQEVSM